MIELCIRNVLLTSGVADMVQEEKERQSRQDLWYVNFIWPATHVDSCTIDLHYVM